MANKIKLPEIKVINIKADDDLDFEDIQEQTFSVSPAMAGNFVTKIARQSPLLNQKVQVQLITKNASTADKIAYELKRFGVELLGVTQNGAKVIMEVSGLLASILMVAWLYKNVVTDVTGSGATKKMVAEGSKQFFKKIPGGAKGVLWAAGLLAAGSLGMYVKSRIDAYKAQNQPSAPALGRATYSPKAEIYATPKFANGIPF